MLFIDVVLPVGLKKVKVIPLLLQNFVTFCNFFVTKLIFWGFIVSAFEWVCLMFSKYVG